MSFPRSLFPRKLGAGIRGEEMRGINETTFRGAAGEVKLKRDEYREDKRHGWLMLET